MSVSVLYNIFPFYNQIIKNLSIQHQGNILAFSSGQQSESIHLVKIESKGEFNDPNDKEKFSYKNIEEPNQQKQNTNVLQWSPDDKFLASAFDSLVIYSLTNEKLIKFYDARDHQLEITALSWSPDSTRIATCGLDGKIIIRNIQKNIKIKEILTNLQILGIVWDTFDRYLCALFSDNQIKIFKNSDWTQLQSMDLNFPSANNSQNKNTSVSKRQDRKIDWSPDFRYILVPSLDDKIVPVVCAMDRQNDFQITKTYMGPFSSINCVKFNPNLYQFKGCVINIFALGDNDGNISIWGLADNLNQNKPFFLLKSHKNGQELIEDIVWNSEGTLMMATTMKKYLLMVHITEDVFGKKLSQEEKQDFLKGQYGTTRTINSISEFKLYKANTESTLEKDQHELKINHNIINHGNTNQQQQQQNQNQPEIIKQVVMTEQQTLVKKDGKKVIIPQKKIEKIIPQTTNNQDMIIEQNQQQQQQPSLQLNQQQPVQNQIQVEQQQPDMQQNAQVIKDKKKSKINEVQNSTNKNIQRDQNAVKLKQPTPLPDNFFYQLPYSNKIIEISIQKFFENQEEVVFSKVRCSQINNNTNQKEIIWSEFLQGRILFLENTQKYLVFYTTNNLIYVLDFQGEIQDLPYISHNVYYLKTNKKNDLMILNENFQLQIYNLINQEQTYNENIYLLLKNVLDQINKNPKNNSSNNNNNNANQAGQNQVVNEDNQQQQQQQQQQQHQKLKDPIENILIDDNGLPLLYFKNNISYFLSQQNKQWHMMDCQNLFELGVLQQQQLQQNNSQQLQIGKNQNNLAGKPQSGLNLFFEKLILDEGAILQSYNQDLRTIAKYQEYILFIIKYSQNKTDKFIEYCQKYSKLLCDVKEVNKMRHFLHDLFVNQSSRENQYIRSQKIDIKELFLKIKKIIFQYPYMHDLNSEIEELVTFQ